MGFPILSSDPEVEGNRAIDSPPVNSEVERNGVLGFTPLSSDVEGNGFLVNSEVEGNGVLVNSDVEGNGVLGYPPLNSEVEGVKTPHFSSYVNRENWNNLVLNRAI